MAWHAIITFGQHTRSNDVGRGMPSSPLDSTHGRQFQAWHDITALGQHHTVRLRRVWHDITAFGQHTRSNDVRSGMPSSPLGSTHCRMTTAWHAIIAHGWKTRSNDVGRKMPSSPLGSTHDRTTSGVACRHGPSTPHTVERCRAWRAIIADERKTRLNDVRRGMPSSPLD